MDSPDGIPIDYNCFLRHEADMWELDRLAERELRTQQLWEDFGLEDDIGKLVDQTNIGWFNLGDASSGTLALQDFMPGKSSIVSSKIFPDLRQPLSHGSPDVCCGVQEALFCCDVSSTDDESDSDSDESGSDASVPCRLENASETRHAVSPRRKSTRATKKVFSDSDFSLLRKSTSQLSSSSSVGTRNRKQPYLRRPIVERRALKKKSPTPISSDAHLSSNDLPKGAFYVNGLVHCGIDRCRQICRSVADLRRHRKSLAHCEKKYTCPGCPMRFTRPDALKRHLHLHQRCKNPSMTALRDQFLETAIAINAKAQGCLDRVLMNLYDTFLRKVDVGCEAGSSRKRRKKALV
ncbi:hypothetical protein B0H19DRAFT_1258117 [Mycena capillaripes]|nr:hypothetical protein B0H19DRAFT_1258117 [Mycena capillaripes]